MAGFVVLENVVKRYQMGEITITAVDGVSFSIEKGEFCIVLGQSGAGKTTVLNLLGGMDSCDEGSILVDGVDVAQFTPRQLTGYRRNDIGFVFQFYNLMQNLTAKENVELAAQICRHPLDAATVLPGPLPKTQSSFCAMSPPARWTTKRDGASWPCCSRPAAARG